MESQDRRRLAFQLEETAPCSDVFYSRLQPSGEAPHTGEDNLPSWSTLQMLISSRKTLTDTSSIVFDQTSGQPVALLSWCIQLTIVEMHQQTLSHPCSRRQEGPQVALDWGQPVISLRAASKSTPYSLTSAPPVPPWGYSEGSRVSLLCRRLAGADQFLKGWRGLCSPQAPEGYNTPCVGPPVCRVSPVMPAVSGMTSVEKCTKQPHSWKLGGTKVQRLIKNKSH